MSPARLEYEAEIARLAKELAFQKRRADLSAKEERELRAKLDQALEWIRVVGEELVLAGFCAGDRSVQLGNLRSLVQQDRDTRGELEQARNACRSALRLSGLVGAAMEADLRGHTTSAERHWKAAQAVEAEILAVLPKKPKALPVEPDPSAG